MRIVVLDGYTTNPGDQTWEPLREFGSLEVYDRTPRERILERCRGAEILLTNKTPLRRGVLEQLQAVEFIGLLATGYDNVDVDFADELGVPVSNVPEYGTESVAEHTVGLILEASHRIGEHDRAVRRGEWFDCPDFTFWNGPIVELAGSVLGIVGFGRIGRRVGRIGSALGMDVLASTGDSVPEPEFEPFEHVENDELFERADVVSLHCPLTDETVELVDEETLRRMKELAFLVNTARGELVDESALAAALRTGEIARAAVDVVSREPIEPDNPLLDAPDCIVTPHNAWTSHAARGRLIETTADNIRAYLEGDPIHVVS